MNTNCQIPLNTVSTHFECSQLVSASVAFINTGKTRGFFSRNRCHYGHLMSEFFGSSCAPGALDLAHYPQANLESLCSLCRANELIIGSAVTPIEQHVSPPLIRGNESTIT